MKRKSNEAKSIMRSKLVKASLELLKNQIGNQKINLRKIGQIAGCAHTNIYNYFQNQKELFWTVQLEIAKQLVKYTEKYISKKGKKNSSKLFFEAQIEFALEFPGWYKFLWLEQIEGPPSPEFDEYINEIKINFAMQFQNSDNQRISDIVHSYLHGELCKLIMQRQEISQNYKKQIIENILLFSNEL